MPRHVVRRLVSLVMFSALAFGPASTRLPAQSGASGPDAARLRALYFQKDYESLVMSAGSIRATDAEARAWQTIALERLNRETDALTAAEKLVADLPANGWSWIAMAAVRNYEGDHPDEANAASAKAIELMPDHPDAIWVRALTLAGAEKTRDEAIRWVDAKRGAVKNPAQLLTVKAYAYYAGALGKTRDEAKLKLAFDTFAEARAIDPKNLDASYAAGTYLTGLRRSAEAFPLLKAAAELAPNSTVVQGAYWRAVNARTDVAADAKLAEIKAAMDTFAAGHSDRSGALFAMSSMYGELKMVDKQRELEEIVLSKFSDSVDAEWILASRWRAVQMQKDDREKAEYRKWLQAYLDRPTHYHEGLWGEAFRNMAAIMIPDKTSKPEALLPVIDGMLKYETMNVHIVHAAMPVMMADNRVLLDKAEAIARGADKVLLAKVESQKEFYNGDGEFERAKSSMVALGYDALGWVLFAEDKIPDAEKELLRSYNLNHENRQNLYHLGKFYETGKSLDKAEEYYVKGLSVSSPGVNPSEAALKSVFEKKATGGSFDEYLAGLREADRTRRRTKILGERVFSPKAVPAFNLKTLDGKVVSLESLKGKVVAINFWGIWCGWCVQELPDFQKLHEQYKDDPEVVILTIDNDQNPNDVPPWMAQKKFNFPVLLDDGFVGSKAGITAFPTTWFLDREGRLVFTKVGWSEKLVEEFGWRIEAIKK